MCDSYDPDLVIPAGNNIFGDDAAVLNHDYSRRHDPQVQEDPLDMDRVAWQGANGLVRKNDLHQIPLKLSPPAYKHHGNARVAEVKARSSLAIAVLPFLPCQRKSEP